LLPENVKIFRPVVMLLFCILDTKQIKLTKFSSFRKKKKIHGRRAGIVERFSVIYLSSEWVYFYRVMKITLKSLHHYWYYTSVPT